MSSNSLRSLVLIATLSGLVCLATPFLSPQPAFSETAKPSAASITTEEIAAPRGDIAKLRKEMESSFKEMRDIAHKQELQAMEVKYWRDDALGRLTLSFWVLTIIVAIIGIGIPVAQGFQMRSQVAQASREADEIRRLREQVEQHAKDALQLLEVMPERTQQAISQIEEGRERALRFSELIVIGNQRIQDKLYDWAKDAYSKALAIDDKSAVAWNGVGWALRCLDDYEGALGAFEKALERDPSYVIALNNKARVYSLQRKRQEMLDALKGAFELDPKLKGLAVFTLEFESYFDDTDFKALIGGEEPTDEETA